MNLRQAAQALLNHWEAGEFQNCTGYMAGHIRVLREAAAQPEWVGLTDDEIWDIGVDNQRKGGGFWGYPRAIEAKLKEKNT